MRVWSVVPGKEIGIKMRNAIKAMVSVSITLAAAIFMGGCASSKSGNAGKEQDVTLEQVSAPARVTINKETAGGHVDKLTKEVERGKTVYDVEATVGGKHMEYLIADADGQLLGTEVPIELSQLPEPVRAATEKYFGMTEGLTIMKGIESGETHYEIEGQKGGKKVEITLDPSGKRSKQ